MHLGDTFEFGNSDCSVASEAVPMINVVCLSNIWLPSHLLQNHGKSINPYPNKPGIFRTLERPVITDCFSTYSESSVENNVSKNDSSTDDDSSDDFSQADMLDILNDCTPTSTTDHIVESPDKENSNLHSASVVDSNLPHHSPYQQFSLGNSCEANFLENKFSVAEETRSVAKDSTLSNLYDTNCETTIKTNSYPLKDSLEEVYNSEDEDFNKDNASLSQAEIFDDVDFTDLLNNSSDILPCGTQENQFDRQQDSSDLATVEASSSHKNSELEDNFTLEELNIDYAQNSFVENLLKYPVAYKKPVVEETGGKQKKEKKKKAPKKKQLLECNLSPDDCGFNNYAPEKDEFYEQVMRQQGYKTYVSEYPSLCKKSQISFIDSTEKMYPYDNQTSGFWETDSISNTTDVTHEQTVSTNSTEFKRTDKKVMPELMNESKNTNTIIIENIPAHVTEEHLHSIVMGYGELKGFSLEECGGFLKAELKMDSDCDVDWMIDCLNGDQPFGATTDVLKCYKIC